jgi:nitrate reductase gamma subunit
MYEPTRRRLGPAVAGVIVAALLLILPGYFSARMMDVGGNANTDVGLSAAVLAGIACISALVGLAILWTGRARDKSNSRVAIVATIFVSVFLLLVAFAAGTSSTEPASTTVERT